MHYQLWRLYLTSHETRRYVSWNSNKTRLSLTLKRSRNLLRCCLLLPFYDCLEPIQKNRNAKNACKGAVLQCLDTPQFSNMENKCTECQNNQQYRLYSGTQTILFWYNYCIFNGTFWIVNSAITALKRNSDVKRTYATFFFLSKHNTIIPQQMSAKATHHRFFQSYCTQLFFITA